MELRSEVANMDAARELQQYTIDDIYALLDGERAELIDGKIYYMAPPSKTHQRISGKLYQTIANYIDSKDGNVKYMLLHLQYF